MKTPKRGYEFQNVKAPKVPYSVFNLSHKNKLTTKYGALTPTLMLPTIPGDKARVNLSEFTRSMPMLAPIMHNIDIYHHLYYIPWRLLWSEFDDLRTSDTSELMEFPMFCFRGGSSALNFDYFLGSGSLADYLNVQTSFAPDLENKNLGSFTNDIYVNALPFFAYAKVWNEYYRDENLQNPLPELNPLDFKSPYVIDMNQPLEDSEDGGIGGPYVELFNIKFRAFRKDYFTSALPWEQKGPDVTLSLGQSAPVSFPNNPRISINNVDFGFVNGDTGASQNITPNNDARFDPVNGESSSSYGRLVAETGTTSGAATAYSIQGNLLNATNSLSGTADLSNATSLTINELRRLNMLQRWEELEARGGSRPIEQTLAHFGEYEDDLRLQRPQYLGGMKSPLTISEVLQTSATDEQTDSTPLADMAGHGVSADNSFIFKNKFKEFGCIICITSVLPEANYMQGIDRFYLARDRYDLPWPLFAHMGEQPVYNAEIYNDGVPLSVEADEQVFGYAPRYSEYKYVPDRIHGELRTTLNYWHMARLFSNQPNLNGQFVSTQDFSKTLRNFAVTKEDPIVMQLAFNISMARHLPMWSTPKL